MTPVDLGNPLHQKVMVKYMRHDDVFLSPMALTYKIAPWGSPEDRHSFGSSRQLIGLEWESFEAVMPRIAFDAELSERGTVTMQRIAGKSRRGHRERLGMALLERLDGTT
jgi:hypothetical protein